MKPEPVTASSRALDPLRQIFGMPAHELFAKKELVLVHGALERFPAFMREGPMAGIDALARHYAGPLEISQGTAEDGIQIPVRDAHASALLRLGLTVFFADMKRALPESGRWLRELEASLGLPECATLSAFVNAPGSGLSLHHDRFDQLFFQILGEKSFRYAPNGFVELPDVQFSPFAAAMPEWGQSYRHGFPLTGEELMARGFQSVTLKPGTAFFMPSGTWHTTAAQPERSLSLVVALRAPSRIEVLVQLLRYYAGQSPDWRARPYGAWSSDEARARVEEESFAKLLADLGVRLPALAPRAAFGTFSAHGFSVGTQSEYPRSFRFERYVRLPNSSVAIEDDAALGKLRCTVASGPTSRPQTKTVLGFNREARPVIDWVLVRREAFDLDEAAAAFPNFGRDDLLDLFGWLAHAALIRPLPAPEWDQD